MKFFSRYPTSTRSMTVVLWTLAALWLSALLSPSMDDGLAQGGIIAIVVLGLTWLTGWSGQISIGNSGFMAFGGYTVAIWASHHATTPIVISLLMATAIGALSGLILGIPATRLRGPYLAGLTLAFGAIISPLAQEFSSWTGGPSGELFINNLVTPGWYQNLFSGANAQIVANAKYPTDLVIVVAGICFLLMANLFHSRVGRAMRLVRDDDVSAELMGVNLGRTRTLAFVIAAGLGGLAGGLQVLLIGNIFPSSFPLTLSITILALMVIGGIGTLTGAVYAGLIYSFISNIISWLENTLSINQTSNFGLSFQNLIFGILLIGTIMLAPRGIAGGLISARQALLRRLRTAHDTKVS